MWVLLLSSLLCADPSVDMVKATSAASPLEGWLAKVKAASFPELKDVPMRVTRFQSDTVFFMSNFDVVAALDDAGPLQLELFMNDGVFARGGGPGEDAIVAILAHELAHSLDYVKRRQQAGAAGLVGLVPALIWPPAEAEMERHTDLVAVQRGYGRGLIAYRQWLYRNLDADAVAEKRRVYYSPLELDLLTRMAERCPTALEAAIADVPFDARAIVARAGGNGGCFR